MQDNETSLERQPSSRSCFVCGRDNDISLKMRWVNDREHDRVVANVTVPEHFNGYPGVVHGGVVAAMLDETAGRSVFLRARDDNFMVTLKLETSYRRPTPTNQPLTVIGRCIDFKPTRAKVAAEIQLEDGTVTARCEAIVVRPPAEFLASWDKEREHWYVDDVGLEE